jgi:purine nucleosidase
MSKQKVIFDTDAGIDDAWALITLLKCEKRFNLDVQAITVVTGNTTWDNGCQNMLLILKTLNRMDIKVYAGAKNSIIHKPLFESVHHGNDGFLNAVQSSEKPSIELVQKKHAVEAMKELIEKVNI